MKTIDTFIAKTVKGFLIIFGLATCLPLLVAYDVNLAQKLIFFNLLDYGPSAVPAIRHWGIMVFGIGLLMIIAAFRPWLRFEAMVFSAVEKSFMVYLILVSFSQPWVKMYTMPLIVDSTIVLYSLLYFLSRYGRPEKWVTADEQTGKTG